MDIPVPYSIKEVKTLHLPLITTTVAYHIEYEEQTVMVLYSLPTAKTVCDAMNIAFRVGYIDGAKDKVLQSKIF